MKTLFLTMSLLFTPILHALSLDESSATAKFIGYKLANKTAVPGTFKDVKFEFVKTVGSAKDILENAKATVDFNKIDTIKNPGRDTNIKEKLVKFMKSPQIIVEFKEISGDDGSGLINSLITMNEVSRDLQMTYEIKEGKIIAKGLIKPTDFMAEAFEKFKNDKLISALHGKMTADEVTIIFEASVK